MAVYRHPVFRNQVGYSSSVSLQLHNLQFGIVPEGWFMWCVVVLTNPANLLVPPLPELPTGWTQTGGTTSNVVGEQKMRVQEYVRKSDGGAQSIAINVAPENCFATIVGVVCDTDYWTVTVWRNFAGTDLGFNPQLASSTLGSDVASLPTYTNTNNWTDEPFTTAPVGVWNGGGAITTNPSGYTQLVQQLRANDVGASICMWKRDDTGPHDPGIWAVADGAVISTSRTLGMWRNADDELPQNALYWSFP